MSHLFGKDRVFFGDNVNVFNFWISLRFDLGKETSPNIATPRVCPWFVFLSQTRFGDYGLRIVADYALLGLLPHLRIASLRIVFRRPWISNIPASSFTCTEIKPSNLRPVLIWYATLREIMIFGWGAVAISHGIFQRCTWLMLQPRCVVFTSLRMLYSCQSWIMTYHDQLFISKSIPQLHEPTIWLPKVLPIFLIGKVEKLSVIAWPSFVGFKSCVNPWEFELDRCCSTELRQRSCFLDFSLRQG